MSQEKIAVLDIETTYSDNIISVGVAIGYSNTFEKIDEKYFVFPEYLNEKALFTDRVYWVEAERITECPKAEGIKQIREFLDEHNIKKIYAFNAGFDYRHLPELHDYSWHDIMRVAKNPTLYDGLSDCVKFTSEGLIKNCGAELVLRMLKKDDTYTELHNGLTDAIDELEIMRLLGVSIEVYDEVTLTSK